MPLAQLCLGYPNVTFSKREARFYARAFHKLIAFDIASLVLINLRTLSRKRQDARKWAGAATVTLAYATQLLGTSIQADRALFWTLWGALYNSP